MTTAHAKQSRRTWLARLRAGDTAEAPTPNSQLSTRAPKLRRDIADLLVMSTVDQKAPVAAPGSADLLDTIVQEHLQRDADGNPHGDVAAREVPEDSAPVLEKELPVETPPVPEEISPDAGNLLKREIEMLLNDAPEEGTKPVAEGLADETPKDLVAEIPAALNAFATPIQGDAAPSPSASSPKVSAAELDVLLERDADARAGEARDSFEAATTLGAEAILQPEPAPTATTAPLMESAPIIEQSLSEAEGVLADELEKLVAESNDAAPSSDASEPSTAATT